MIALQRATPHIGDCCIEGVLQPSTESARWAPTPFDDDKKTSFPCISILSSDAELRNTSQNCFSAVVPVVPKAVSFADLQPLLLPLVPT